MIQEHPFTPPQALVKQWIETWYRSKVKHTEIYSFLATCGAQWGADQELEACCEWFQEFYKTESWVKHDLKHFRAARRPKPLRLKERLSKAIVDGNEREALKLLEELDD